MKFLRDYLDDKQSAIFKEHGAYFAFSNEQHKEQATEGVKYVHIGAGLICPKLQAKSLIDALDKSYKEGIAEDMEENGKQAIIERELWNHEAIYVYSTESTIDALKSYPITEAEIIAVFRELCNLQTKALYS